MTAKCSKCGCQIGDGEHGDITETIGTGPAILTIKWNGLVPESQFAGVFGIWDQRAKKTFWICGSCLVNKLAD